jgi:osmotically-inducible protein OsmY
MRIRCAVSLLIAFMASALLAGCMTPPEEGSASDMDRQIAREVMNRLAQDPVTAGRSFGVSVANGVVTLEGAVPGENLRLRAVAVARSTPDVRDVVDKLYRVENLGRW